MKAFPIQIDNFEDYEDHPQTGTDLRDYFAAKAMQGIVSALTTPNGLSNTDEPGVSKAAYKISDAMMQARKTEGTEMGKSKVNWTSVENSLPSVDNFDEWNAIHRISKDVLCYSKEFGKRFGRYYHSAGFWQVDGVSSSRGVKVDYWTDINNPDSSSE